MIIREEKDSDHKDIERLIEKAFALEVHSDHREHFLVKRLRKSSGYIPSLALVATTEQGDVIGYIMLTKILINQTDSLALAPIAILPDFQRQGIGSKLIEYAHQKARELNYQSIILLGHADYYPRFGYTTLSRFGIKMPFDIPEEYCMALELTPNSLSGVSGEVIYPKEFFE